MLYLTNVNKHDVTVTLGWQDSKVFFNTADIQNRTEQNIYFIDVNCTVSCKIHEYNNKFTNGHNRCMHDLTTKS